MPSNKLTERVLLKLRVKSSRFPEEGAFADAPMNDQWDALDALTDMGYVDIAWDGRAFLTVKGSFEAKRLAA